MKVNNYLNSIVLLMLLAFVIVACDKEDTKKEDEKIALEAYIKSLEAAGDTLEPTASGMYYIETLEGTGEQAVVGKYAKVRYKGSLIDGTVFDTNIDNGKDPFSFIIGVDNVIQGWHEGIAYMKVGGQATLIIPSDLGYGDREVSTIPPYSTLIFEVELIEVYEP